MVVRVLGLVVLWLFAAESVLAQTAPCGRTVVVVSASDKPTEERFLAAPLGHVKASLVRALPSVAASLKSDNGAVVTARIPRLGLATLWYETNRKAGVKGAAKGTTSGDLTIELRPETRGDVAGTNIKIEFMAACCGNPKGAATQLMEETACLTGLLSQTDPTVSPSGGVAGTEPGSDRVVTLPGGTPLRVVLRDPLFSNEALKDKQQTRIVFEVAADVTVEGARVIRKGALGMGRIADDARAVGGFGQSAHLKLVVDHVTAADGQSISVTGAVEGQQLRDLSGAGLFIKGLETMIRAGTSYEVEVSGSHAIKVVR
jgi:hypothetical protein